MRFITFHIECTKIIVDYSRLALFNPFASGMQTWFINFEHNTSTIYLKRNMKRDRKTQQEHKLFQCTKIIVDYSRLAFFNPFASGMHTWFINFEHNTSTIYLKRNMKRDRKSQQERKLSVIYVQKLFMCHQDIFIYVRHCVRHRCEWIDFFKIWVASVMVSIIPLLIINDQLRCENTERRISQL